jgi:geranylgeranyl diphosphate synthase type I
MEQRTLEGKALDLGWVRDGRWDVTVDDYLYMATHKTAYYSAATPLACGAICAGGTDEQIEALFDFGLDAGLAFQLQDDLLNLVGDPAEQGKDFRSDITEGKRTMIAVWALAHLEDAERSELQGILESGTSNQAELARAVELMEASGAIDFTREHAHMLAERAKATLERTEFNERALVVLRSMADFFVERLG